MEAFATYGFFELRTEFQRWQDDVLTKKKKIDLSMSVPQQDEYRSN